MKKIAILLLCTLVFVSCKKDDHDFDVFTVMDDVEFRWYCRYYYDTNEDGRLSFEEARAVTKMNISNKEIESLKGLEYFTSLTYLDCSTNSLNTLDLSKNTALTYLNCGGNRLSTLDLSKNTALTYLNCGGNRLSTLDLSHNTSLERLYCGSNPNLTTIYLWAGFTGFVEKDHQSNFVIK